MAAFEARVLAYICVALGVVSSVVNSLGLSLLFFLVGLTFFGVVFYLQYKNNGGGPLSPA